jgi:hypothetical protein
MKLKRSKYISVFFLVSFFISVSTNICLASIASPTKNIQTQTKDHLRLNETSVSSSINDFLFEENENEDENELDLDLSQVLIPFFLEYTIDNTPIKPIGCMSSMAISPQQPIYIRISNFRI